MLWRQVLQGLPNRIEIRLRRRWLKARRSVESPSAAARPLPEDLIALRSSLVPSSQRQNCLNLGGCNVPVSEVSIWLFKNPRCQFAQIFQPPAFHPVPDPYDPRRPTLDSLDYHYVLDNVQTVHIRICIYDLYPYHMRIYTRTHIHVNIMHVCLHEPACMC